MKMQDFFDMIWENGRFALTMCHRRIVLLIFDSEELGWSPFTAALRYCTFMLREAGGRGRGAMIDLSHLTEEEQGAIMTVLRRDAELKKAEDDRIR